MRGRPGRKRLDPTGEVNVAVKLPAGLVDRLDAFAADEFATRATVIRDALETALGAPKNDGGH